KNSSGPSGGSISSCDAAWPDAGGAQKRTRANASSPPATVRNTGPAAVIAGRRPPWDASSLMLSTSIGRAGAAVSWIMAFRWILSPRPGVTGRGRARRIIAQRLFQRCRTIRIRPALQTFAGFSDDLRKTDGDDAGQKDGVEKAAAPQRQRPAPAGGRRMHDDDRPLH